MGKLFALITFLMIGVAGFVIYRCYFFDCHNEATKFMSSRADGWYGSRTLKAGEQIPKDNTEIRPFKVNISDSVLQDLKYRLDHSRYIDHVEDTQFTYGFNSLQLRKVVEYWRTKYNWRQQEKMLNQYPQFKTQIEGIDIHFLHVKPGKPAKVVLPLLILHGWPGSVLEYYKAIPLLTEPVNDVAFELVIPSIPGYGYSEAPHQKGFNALSCARVYVKLMKRLGHEKFVVHGGDWGHLISKILGSVHHENEKFGLMLSESGYLHIQATKPDTVGSVLVDSPVGLAAYILEKFSTLANLDNPGKEDGGLTEKFTLDELLTNVMIYWTSNNVASSLRFYKESIGTIVLEANSINLKVKVPAATIDIKHDLGRSPRKLIESQYTDLIQYTELENAGHFTAFEDPKSVADDIRTFVVKILFRIHQESQQKEKKQTKHVDM